MTRPINPELSDRILNAARAAWLQGGDSTFDVRSIAAAAGTTIATLYARFTNRDGLLLALRQESLQTFFKTMGRAETAMAFCEAYLRFAETRRRDYELIFGARWRDRSEPGGVEDLTNRLADRVANELGVDGPECRSIGLQLWLMLHGAASERILERKPGSLWIALKTACLDGCAALLRMQRRPSAEHGVPAFSNEHARQL